MEEFPPPLRILQLIFTGLAIFLFLFLVIVLAMPQEFFGIPAVAMDNSSSDGPPFVVTRSFLFGKQSETVTVAVDRSVYEASKDTHRNIILLGDQKVAGAQYYSAMIYDPSQEQIYTDLISGFRRIRAERNLTDDEYLELIAACIQSIPYKGGGNAPPKYPAELLVEGMGDCDDKSILISGLLAREGYTVVLLKFGPEGHMSMGVGSDAFPYKTTGYTYLEGMTPAYVGSPTAHLMISLNSDPLVIPVGDGTKIYHSGNETQYLIAMSNLAKERAAALSHRLDPYPASEQNNTEYQALAAERDRYTAIRAYILGHPYDRMGVYKYVQQEMAEKGGTPV
ncbi:MAG: hypothetical protein M0Q92_06080 [Methanoregula sp.]|nr:hypothetical protein [Methanoregula sp.]